MVTSPTWTGRHTLREIESTVGRLRAEEGQLDAAISSAAGEAERLSHDRAEALRELARIKLDELTAGRLVRGLDAAEQRALQVLENVRLKLSSIHAEHEKAVSELAAAESERNDAAGAVEAAVEAVDEVRAEAEARARSLPRWATAQQQVDAARRIAEEAEKKSAQSTAELAAKQKPYDSDPLFAYLWSSNYGTSKYSGRGLVRYVDGLIAEFIGYPEARSSYNMLVEIPKRLTEHARLQREAVGDAEEILGQLARAAMIEAGIEPKERALAEARHRLAGAEGGVERKRKQLQEIEAQRASLVESTSDARYDEALMMIARADAQDSIDRLQEEARRTSTPADDEIVRRIGGIDKRLTELQAETRDLRQSAKNLADRRAEMEKVRERFHTSGLDHPNATFRNGNEIGAILMQILEGVVRSGILWDILRAGFGTRAPRSRPDFGSPTFPSPFPLPGGGTGARGGEWREPGTQGGWSPPLDMPSGGDRSGGDDDRFKTGGSF